jgi:hypothetical protein
MIENCNVSFMRKHLIINNVKRRSIVEHYASRKMRQNVIDAYYFADDYIDEALKYFGVTRESLGIGFCYSAAEFAGIYLVQTDYLLHFASDSFVPAKDTSNWILDACAIFAQNPAIVAANPTWDFRFDEAKSETNGQTIGNFYVGCGIKRGFSDQCYLIRTKDFKQHIYNYSHPASARYPCYGGELFEKRVDSYMRICGKQRITSKQAVYLHKNFPRGRAARFFVKLLIYTKLYYPLKAFKKRRRAKK